MLDKIAGHGNKLNRPARSVAVLIALLALTGCASLSPIVRTPEVSFQNLKIEEASLTDGIFNFIFVVNNPNPVGLRASRITYALKINGASFINGKLDRGISLPSNGAGQMAIPVHIRYLDAFDSMVDMVRRKTAAYDISGKFYIGPIAIPYQARGVFNLPQMPKIRLENIRIEQLSLLGARLRCRLNLDNTNDFALPLQRLDYNLKLGKTSFAQASAKPAGPIAAKSETGMDLSLDVSFAQLGASAYQLLQGKSTDYRLDGKLVMDKGSGSKLLPFSLGGKVPLLK